MKYPGFERVKKIYPIWAAIYLSLFAIMIILKIKLPYLLLIITTYFSLKTILIDYRIIKMRRKRVYWLEHGPFQAEIIIIWALAEIGIDSFQGYINFPTMLISAIGFILDFWKDLKENPKVYGK